MGKDSRKNAIVMRHHSLRAVKNFVAFVLIRCFIVLFRWLPYRIAIGLGGTLGALWWRFGKRDRNIAVANIKEHWDRTNAESLSKRCFISSGKSAAMMIRLGKGLEQFEITFAEREIFDEQYRKGKGIIALTGHIGPFEIIPAYIASLGYKVAVVARNLYDPRLDRLLVRQRERFGIVDLPSTVSARPIIKALRDGYAVGVLGDVRTRSVRSSESLFFGASADTVEGPVLIARSLGLPLLPLAIFPAGGRRLVLRVLPPVAIPSTDDRKHDLEQGLLLMNRALEQLISLCPEQWIWYHPRW